MKIAFDGSGDVIVITGAANGIGKALALEAARVGAKVVACDVSAEGLRELHAQNPSIQTEHLDVSDRDRVFNCLKGVEKQHGHIDALVCGAAIQPRTNVHDMDADEWLKVVSINLNGVVWCYQAVIEGMMRRKRGSIVAFGSGLAHQGWPKASAYAATKGALIAFIKSAAKEVAPHRVRVNLIAPGVIDTPQYRAANAGVDHDSWKSSTGVGQPDDVVGPLMFLLSDAATMTASLLSRDFVYPREG